MLISSKSRPTMGSGMTDMSADCPFGPTAVKLATRISLGGFSCQPSGN